MTSGIDMTLLEEAADVFLRRFGDAPVSRAVICGSGWSAVLDELEVEASIPFTEVPGLGAPGVAGHSGEIALCRDADSRVLIFKGRRHFYEGEGWTPVALPIHLCVSAGVERLLLTNSAGAVNPEFGVGELMLITDHFNAMGDNPLVGPHLEAWGPRFPDLSHVYNPTERERLRCAGEAVGLSLREGIYFATRGPVYETPAEVRAWRTLGADAVGMSTVPEAILAHAAGLKVAGVSCLTNFAAGIGPHPLSHEEVTDTTARTLPNMKALVRAWISA